MEKCRCSTTKYCGIIIVLWGLMFVDFRGHSYPRNFLKYYFKQIELSLRVTFYRLPTKLHLHKSAKFFLPTNIAPPPRPELK